MKLWPVGTWPLKGAFYADLRKEGVRSGAETDPPGYCHFGTWLDEGFFRQITAEYLVEEKFKGRARKFWKQRPAQRDNHFLDCAVYAMALAEHLGLSSLTAAEWAGIARERGAPLEMTQASKLAPPREGAEPPVYAAPTTAAAIGSEYEVDDLDARLARLMKANGDLFSRQRGI